MSCGFTGGMMTKKREAQQQQWHERIAKECIDAIDKTGSSILTLNNAIACNNSSSTTAAQVICFCRLFLFKVHFSEG